MWEWRDENARGQWRLDGSGSWIWDEPSLLERVGLGAATFGPTTFGPTTSGPAQSGPGSFGPWSPPEPWSPPPGGHPEPWTDVRPWSDAEPRTESWEIGEVLAEETPIFEAVAEDQERDDAGDRRRRHGVLEEPDDDGHPGATDRAEYRTAPWIPEPSPGSGPFPAQKPARARRGASVDAGRAEGPHPGERGPDPDVPARHARSPYDDGDDDGRTADAEEVGPRVGGRHTLRR